MTSLGTHTTCPFRTSHPDRTAPLIRPATGRSTLWLMTPPPAPTLGSFSSEVLSIEVDGHVATLWLDRPEKRNAMGPAFWDDLPVAMAAIADEPSIRAVVIAAKGPHFSVGLDLVAMSGIAGGAAPGDGPRPSAAARAWRARGEITRLQASITAVADSPLPVVAAVHGWCIGGGVDLIAACD